MTKIQSKIILNDDLNIRGYSCQYDPVSLNVLYYSHVIIVIAGPHDFRKLEFL